MLSWEQVGNYAIRFDFSDGHRTGLYTYDYLRKLGSAQPP
ncbi:MAG TPA: gamma-butyrobetaine hydroxylase-like domain-containing protein [Opitutaceae bacterium]